MALKVVIGGAISKRMIVKPSILDVTWYGVSNSIEH